MVNLSPRTTFSSLTSMLVCYALVLLLLPFTLISGAPRNPINKAKVSTRPNQQTAAVREGELLIRFRAGVSDQKKEAVLLSHGTKRKNQLRGDSTIEKLELAAGQNVQTLAMQLSLNPDVEFAEPNFLIDKDDLVASDPQFDQQWALRNTGQSGGQFGSDINVATAWQTTTGSRSAVIAVIDSGIDFSHPDLTNNRWENPAPSMEGDVNGWDYVADSGVIRDEQGHGTAIAGIIAAEGNNAIGITGVMWRASLMSLRVLDNTGTGDVASAIEAMDYAVAHGAQVINLSWGTNGSSLALKDAIERAIRRGVVVVCSAGNNGQDVDSSSYYPASFGVRDLIAVASTDNFDQLTSWSDYGRRNITIAAPGNNILTTQMGGGYWTVSGTSASAPFVAGVAGLVKTMSPSLSPHNTAKAISDGARKVASLSGKISSGGVVDASAALTTVRGNPYGGNGGHQGNNGQGNGQGYTPPALRPDNPGRANGTDGHRESAPPAVAGAPAPNLPNLTELRNSKPEQPRVNQPIEANLACADCDPQNGGGGGSYYPTDDPNFSTARKLLANETGTAGVDLGSRNFNWSQTLLGLAGRAGLDLNLTLSYNSLVWTKSGSYIKYNGDLGTPAPGFKLGLPTLQQRFLNSQTGNNSYLMVLPSGGRVEMREVSVGVYESADRSYTQLKEGPYYSITNRRSGLAAAVAGTSQANGAQIVQWPNPGNDPNYEWQLVPTDSGYYKLVNHNSGKVAAVAGVSYADGANVVQWDWAAGANHEQWQVVSAGSGYYRLIARHSGKSLVVAGGSYTAGAYLQQSTYSSGTHQQWQLTPVPSQTVTVRSSDGTQYTFTRVTINNEFRCTQIKDRNGNYISATYDTANGHLQTVTDTLGRVVTFIYYPDGNLQAIRQTWAGVAHDWATFNYGQVLVIPQFGGGLMVNGPNNNYVTVLTQVNLHDGSYFTFEYNAAFGQVNRINHYAADTHLLAYSSYNVPSGAGQTDCPRFTERRDWAQNWNGDTDGVPATNEETVTTYAVAADSSWSKVTAPNGTIHKQFFATTGWQTGLTTTAKNYANATDEAADAAKKWTTVSWTQDDTNLSYAKNPRVIETNIYDAEGNRKRVTINYGAYASYSLPYEVTEYAADASTIVRRTLTDYNLSSSYLDRRIIGLTSAVNVIDQATGATVSKLTFDYDWAGEYLAAMPQAATQHDATNYGIGFVTGRGNLSAVSRWDVTDINNAAKAIQQERAGYNTTGALIFSRDALGHQTNASYTDSFSDNVNRNTFAYPTTVADAEGFQSFLKYNFDYGALTWKQTPSPNAGQTAPNVSLAYDSAARVQQITNGVNNAYMRWVYPTSQTVVQTFSTMVSGAGEAYTAQLFDGAGRIRATSSDHPGSTGLYSGQYLIYNNMGQLSQKSNPTEMYDTWVAAGDDVYVSQNQGGWRYTQQAYDWKGRPTLTTNADGTTKVTTYGGCGCAGGEVTTTQDEHGRQRRLTKDTFGRLWKVEELNWNLTVYATTTYTYNARNQITQSNQAGQIRSFTHDGYGRLQSRTTPEQGTTNYSYNLDDTTNVMTDARGATTTFGYNPRQLIGSITYGAAGGAAATPNVGFGYDGAGNRTSMTDGMGSVTYVYNQLSQMTSETRNFTGVGSYTLSYGYNLAGQLASFTNHWGAQISYGYDKTGRVTAVTGSGYAGGATYASSIAYRAFGAVKGMNYPGGLSLSTTYDNRLRTTKWDVSSVLGYNYNYDYLNEHTGRVTYAGSIYDATLDRSYEYDYVGRLVISHSGTEARAHTYSGQWGIQDGPYSQGYDYDVWGNVTHKYGWGGEVQGGTPSSSTDIYYSYTGNRRNGFSYDAAGNLTNDIGQNFTYDVTGQQTASSYTNLQNSYDGDGRRVKRTEDGLYPALFLRSSVLGGQVVAEIDYVSGSWQWWRGYVYQGSRLLAVQQGGVFWVHEDPVTKSKRVTNSAGSVVSRIELDPWGADTNRSTDAAFQPKKFTSYERDANGSDEAMFRRYNRWHSRFDQPDPYEGSYNLSNPQSFNRYAYTQNDPVNYVDPSGLNLRFADPLCQQLWEAYNHASGISMGDFADWAVGCQLIGDERPPVGDPGPGGGDPGKDPSPSEDGKDDRTDCEKMADDAQRIAGETRNEYPDAKASFALQQFNQKFGMVTFGSYFAEGPLGFLGTPASSRNDALGTHDYRGSSGFPDQFKDSINPGEDAVHHFGAYFSAGIAGHKLAPDYHRADDRRNGNMGDVRLADQSRGLGAYLRGHPDQLSNIGQLIRDIICAAGAIPK